MLYKCFVFTGMESNHSTWRGSPPVLDGGHDVAVAGQVVADRGVRGSVAAEAVAEDEHGELVVALDHGGLPQHWHVNVP